MQKESRENRPQFTSVDYPSISEEPVEPQSFRSVLTRALGWTAFVPLFMLAFLQSQQLQRMVDVTNHQQLLTAQMIADSFDNKVEQIGRLLILSYPDLISEADHESAYRHLIAIAPQIVSIERAHVDSLSQTQRSDLTAVLENRKIEAHVTKCFSQSNGWFLRLKVQEQNLDTVIIATINASELLEMGTPAADSSPFAIRILTKGGRRVYGLNEDSIDLARLHLLHEDLSRLKESPDGTIWRTEGTRNTAMIRALVPVKSTGWTVLAAQTLTDRDRLLMQSLENSGFLFIFAIVMTLLIGYYVSRPMKRKVDQLLEQVENFAKNRTIPPAPSESSFKNEGPSEILELQKSFHNMAVNVSQTQKRLEHLNAYLESEVDKRTESLSKLFSELDLEHQTLTAVLESMTEGVILVGRSGLINYANQRAQTFLYQEGSLVGQLAHEMIFKHYRALTDRDSPELLMKNPSIVRMVNVHDAEKVVDVVTFFVHNLPGRSDRIGLLFRDVSQTAQISKLKDSLIGIVAHELKTPIATMRLQAETLTRGSVRLSETDKREILSDMVDESKRLSSLIDDWLDISRLQEGRFDLQLKVVQVAALIDRAIKLTRQRYDVSFVKHIDPEAECMRVDPDRITQVFINLFVNAGRYKKEGTQARCEISVHKVEQMVEIVVKDYGIGIEADQLEKIFDRFYQIDMTSRRRIGGTGLGLAICRAICEAHGGSIRAESVPGQWTQFIVRLPY